MIRDDINSPMLQSLYDYWLDSCQVSAAGDIVSVPHENVIDPVEMPAKALRFLTLFEVAENPFELYVKLTGSGIEDYCTKPQKGLHLKEMGYGDDINPVEGWYKQSAVEGSALRSDIDFVTSEHNLLKVERLSLPYQDDKGRISMLMSCIHFLK